MAQNNEKYEKKVQNFKKLTEVSVLIIVISIFGITLVSGTFDIVPSGAVRIAVDPSGETVGPIDSGWHSG